MKAFKLSIVIPVFRNSETIASLCSELLKTLKDAEVNAVPEFVLVNDGSSDDSWDQIAKLHAESPEVFTAVDLSRNFGQINALLAGYRHATGDAVVSMSADFQDDPSVVPKLIAEWLSGAKLVVAARARRSDGPVKDATSKFVWSLFRKYAVPQIPEGGFDFFLMDREVCDRFIDSPEQNIFLQGRLLYFGYEPAIVPYERMPRRVGVSQTSFAKRLKYFVDGFVGHSYLPLRLVTAIGLLSLVAGVLASIAIFILVVSVGSRVEGWASLVVLILLANGVQMFSIGIIGEYLWRAIEEIRGRPHYVVRTALRARGAQ